MTFFYIVSRDYRDGHVFFIRVYHEGKECCFQMNKYNGDHYDNKKAFHNPTYYLEKRIEWREKERVLPPEYTVFAQKIAEKFFSGEATEEKSKRPHFDSLDRKVPFKRVGRARFNM